MLGDGEEGRRPPAPRGRSHHPGADANLPPAHTLGPQPNDPRIFGVEPGQPVEAFLHAGDGSRAWDHSHRGLGRVAVGVLHFVHRRRPRRAITTGAILFRQEAQGVCGFLEAILNVAGADRKLNCLRLGEVDSNDESEVAQRVQQHDRSKYSANLESDYRHHRT